MKLVTTESPMDIIYIFNLNGALSFDRGNAHGKVYLPNQVIGLFIFGKGKVMCSGVEYLHVNSPIDGYVDNGKVNETKLKRLVVNWLLPQWSRRGVDDELIKPIVKLLRDDGDGKLKLAMKKEFCFTTCIPNRKSKGSGKVEELIKAAKGQGYSLDYLLESKS